MRWDEDAFYERGGVYDWTKEMTVPETAPEEPAVRDLAASGKLNW